MGASITRVVKFIRKGEDGTSVSIVSTSVSWHLSSSGTMVPEGDWLDSIPELTDDTPYLWARTAVTYSDGNFTTSYSVSYKGKDGQSGKGISSADVMFAVGSSGATAPESFTSTTASGLITYENRNSYLWQAVLVTYTDGTTAYSGAACLGVVSGFATATEMYAIGTADAPTGSWYTSTDSITKAKGSYLWTTTRLTYNSGGSSYTTAICVGYWGTDGSKGDKGDTGSKGEKGSALRGPQFWTDLDTGYSFQAGGDGEAYLDTVIYNGNYYSCKTSHTKTASNYPGSTASENGSLWQLGDKIALVAARILLAERIKADQINVEDLAADDGFIKNLNTKSLKAKEVTTEDTGGGHMTMAGNTMEMYNSSGQTRLRLTGNALSSLPSTSGNGNGPSSAKAVSCSKRFSPNTTREDTNPVSVVSFTASADMILTFPELVIDTKASISTARGREVGVTFRAAWVVDSKEVALTYGDISGIGSSSTSDTSSITLGRTSVNVASGSHTVYLSVTITVGGSSPYTTSDTLTAGYSCTIPAKSILWAASAFLTEVANDGFRTSLAANAYFVAYMSGSSPVIEMRNGNYGLQITSSGIKKMTDGSNWNPASL